MSKTFYEYTKANEGYMGWDPPDDGPDIEPRRNHERKEQDRLFGFVAATNNVALVYKHPDPKSLWIAVYYEDTAEKMQSEEYWMYIPGGEWDNDELEGDIVDNADGLEDFLSDAWENKNGLNRKDWFVENAPNPAWGPMDEPMTDEDKADYIKDYGEKAAKDFEPYTDFEAFYSRHAENYPHNNEWMLINTKELAELAINWLSTEGYREVKPIITQMNPHADKKVIKSTRHNRYSQIRRMISVIGREWGV